MRAMKDSGIEWIGEIPREWDVRRIKFTLDKHSGGSWGTNEGEGESDCICVRVADFNYPKLSVDFHDKMTVRSYAKKAIEEGCIKSGDILLEKSGGGDITPVGRSVLFESDEQMMCANFIEWLRPNQCFDARFLNYWLAAAYVNGFSKRNVKQTTGIQNLDVPAFLSERIAAPVVDAQEAIANFLDAKCAEIDALIAAKEKTNALLKERRQSIIYEAVTKGLNPDAHMKDSGIEWIGKIPEDWSTVRVKYTGSYKSGNTITAADVKESGTFPVYGGNGLRGYTDEITHDGDHLLIGRQGALCGNVHMVSGKFWASEHAVVGTINANYAIRFLFYVLDVFDLNRLSTSAAQPGISVEQITDVVIPCPTLVEQQEIANVLDAKCAEVDELISANEATIQKLKEYRQSIIYEAVTGKIEV